MGNILRCFKGEEDDQYPYYRPTSRPHYPAVPTASQPHQQQQHDVAALAHDLLNFDSASMVPEGLGQHVMSSKKAQVKWTPHPNALDFSYDKVLHIYPVTFEMVKNRDSRTNLQANRCLGEVYFSRRPRYQNILEAYKNTTPPPRTPAEAAELLVTALNWIQRADLEGILKFYNFPIPSLPAASSNHHPSSIPEDVQFVLNTLPVHNQNIGDGDGFTAYVAATDPRESANVPLEVHEMVIARTEARNRRDYQRANALQSSLKEAGYKIIVCSDEEILAKKYRIRMRGIDAPELKQLYGEESKNALAKLIGGKSTTIHVYEQDQFDCYVGDIYCNNVFIQEQMLKNGHAWYFKAYDKRPELAQWENEAHRGLWASGNPEKTWVWRKNQRNGGPNTIQVY